MWGSLHGCLQLGLSKLLAAEAEVSTMKAELIELQPKLIEAGTCVL